MGWMVYLIPIFNIEAEIHMKILMMVIVEDTRWLPWLPPVGLEIDSRMVDDAVVISVKQEECDGDWNSNIERFLNVKYIGKDGTNDYITYSNELALETWEKWGCIGKIEIQPDGWPSLKRLSVVCICDVIYENVYRGKANERLYDPSTLNNPLWIDLIIS